MKRALVFLGGDPPSREEVASLAENEKRAADKAFVVCADSGYRCVKGILRPDLVLGDFDSMDSTEAEEGVTVKRFNKRKDYTDGHIAVEEALLCGADSIRIYGAFGGRPDMEYANLSLLYLAAKGGAECMLVGGGRTVRLVKGDFAFAATAGDTVSLVPFFASAHILKTEGLSYPLFDATLDRLHILGISNEAVADRVRVVSEDELLVFTETNEVKQ